MTGCALNLTWTWKRFELLSIDDVYDLLELRSRIFVVEQNCVFLDADGADRSSWHLLGRTPDDSATLCAYLRCVDPGIKYEEPSIGRVVVAAEQRGGRLGRTLMQEGIARTVAAWPDRAIVIGAQRRLEDFYRSLGFQSEGPAYLEDGIEHVTMRVATRTEP